MYRLIEGWGEVGMELNDDLLIVTHLSITLSQGEKTDPGHCPCLPHSSRHRHRHRHPGIRTTFSPNLHIASVGHATMSDYGNTSKPASEPGVMDPEKEVSGKTNKGHPSLRTRKT
jgi:hypothetical protein